MTMSKAIVGDAPSVHHQIVRHNSRLVRLRIQLSSTREPGKMKSIKSEIERREAHLLSLQGKG